MNRFHYIDMDEIEDYFFDSERSPETAYGGVSYLSSPGITGWVNLHQLAIL